MKLKISMTEEEAEWLERHMPASKPLAELRNKSTGVLIVQMKNGIGSIIYSIN